MSKEGVQRFEKFLPQVSEPTDINGFRGIKRSVIGRKSSGPYAGEYSLQKIELQSDNGALEIHELRLQRPFDGTERAVVFTNGEITLLEGFGDEYTQHEVRMYAGVLVQNFILSEEFIPPLEID